MKILFLGAGKLWQLMRHFHEDARAIGIDLELHSMELESRVPIAEYATVHVGPKFSAPNGRQAIVDLATQIGADIVVPNADNATVALSSVKDVLAARGIDAAVSTPELCATMHDKIAAEDWFARHGDPRPMPTARAPAIAKLRDGYASKGIYPLPTQLEVDAFRARADAGIYLIQEYIEGDEFTVDAYVDRAGRVVDILTRQRLVVEAGIVLNSLTRWDNGIIAACQTILSRPGWYGPQTLQFRLDSGQPKILEINPRFGGGVTHSIHCGLRIPRWLMEERLGRLIQHDPFRWPRGSLMTRARVDIFHDHRG